MMGGLGVWWSCSAVFLLGDFQPVSKDGKGRTSQTQRFPVPAEGLCCLKYE